MFSGNVGTGVMIAHRTDDTWSPPSALGLGGIGFGFMIGAEVKDILICVMDDTTLGTLSAENQIKIGGQVSQVLSVTSYRLIFLIALCITFFHRI